MPRHALLIINPTAGHYTPKTLRLFEKALRDAGITTSYSLTKHAGDGEKIARKARHEHSADIIIAGGGDGTVAEVAQALIGSSIILAILPIGTANVLASELRIPFGMKRNAALLASGHRRTIWPGLLTHSDISPHHSTDANLPISSPSSTPSKEGQIIIQMAGIGPDGWIVHNVSRALKNLLANGRMS